MIIMCTFLYLISMSKYGQSYLKKGEKGGGIVKECEKYGKYGSLCERMCNFTAQNSENNQKTL